MLLPLWLGALNPVCGMGESHVRVHGRGFHSRAPRSALTKAPSHQALTAFTGALQEPVPKTARPVPMSAQCAVEEWMNHKRHKSHKIDSVFLFCVLCAFCGSNLSSACPKQEPVPEPEASALKASMLQPLWLGALNPVCGMGESHVRFHGRGFHSRAPRSALTKAPSHQALTTFTGALQEPVANKCTSKNG